MSNLFFQLLLLKLGHSKSWHFIIQLFPVLFLLLFELYHFGVALLYEILGSLYFFLGSLGDCNVFEFFSHVYVNQINFKTKMTLNTHITLFLRYSNSPKINEFFVFNPFKTQTLITKWMLLIFCFGILQIVRYYNGQNCKITSKTPTKQFLSIASSFQKMVLFKLSSLCS